MSNELQNLVELKNELEKTTPLVNVSALATYSQNELVNNISDLMTTLEKSAFKIVTRVAYVIGEKIPIKGTDGHAIIPKAKKLSMGDLSKKIGKSKATISRWIKAFRYILENGLFDKFNEDYVNYPFSFDKIIIIFSNKLVTEEVTFEDLMSKTVVELEELANGDSEESEESTKSEESEESEESEVTPSGKMVTFVYGDKTFEVDEAILLNFLNTKCLLK